MVNMNRTKESLFLRRKRLLERDLNLQSNHKIVASDNNKNLENKHYENKNDTIHHEKITRRNELFSQLPSSTKVSTISNVEPTKYFEINDIGRLENHFSIFASSGLSDVNEDIERQISIDSFKDRGFNHPSSGQDIGHPEKDQINEANKSSQKDFSSNSQVQFKIESNFDSHEIFNNDEIDESSCYENQLENEFDVSKEDVNELNGSEYFMKPGEASIRNNHRNSTKKIKRPRKKRNAQKSSSTKNNFTEKYKKNVFITCEHCGKESRGDKFHAKHLYTTHGIEKKVECRQCAKECLSIRDLDRHRRTSHIIASCEQCARPFYNPQDLDKHLKNVHHIGQKEDEFICELCAQKFQTKQYLRVHMRVHRDRNIKCTLCEKAFRWESGLKSHMAAAHSQLALLYNCEFCGKQFKDKGNWKSHRYTHLDHKPHSCSMCKKGFIRKDMLLAHEKSCKT